MARVYNDTNIITIAPACLLMGSAMSMEDRERMTAIRISAEILQALLTEIQSRANIMAMTCSGCGSKDAYRVSFSSSGETCDKCSPSSTFRFSDVFFKKEYFDPMLADPKKSPFGTLIRSREHKAQVMREIGVRESGDKSHGSIY